MCVCVDIHIVTWTAFPVSCYITEPMPIRGIVQTLGRTVAYPLLLFPAQTVKVRLATVVNGTCVLTLLA